jgi:uncharacterized protein YbgA (DUF1722 family)/uncharacterized protein YbbK (DUF523 family)
VSAAVDPATPIRIGISSCLLGARVRWDGNHKRDGFLVDTFGRWVEWVPICPEIEVGMGVPRETVRLERHGEAIRMVAPGSGRDWTEAMESLSARRVDALASADLCGYVLKKDSPSCGMERVKTYPEAGMPRKDGVGLFARALLARFPNLPVEEEGRLSDPRLRDNFVERVFAYHRLRHLLAGRFTVGELVAFHTAHKLQLMSHSQKHYRELGRLVAVAKGRDRGELAREYEGGLMAALKAMATPRRHVNVLQHVAGYFRESLDDASRRELAGVIEEYGKGLLPLIVPITLVRHHVRVLGVDYLAGQTYLEPHPRELMLRNHV